MILRLFQQNGSDLRNGTAVCHGDGQFQSARGIRGNIDNGVSHDLPIGNDDSKMIGCLQYGIKNSDIRNDAGFSLHGDPVAETERSKQQDHNAACKVAQRSLQCKPYGNSRRCNRGGYRCDGNSQNGNDDKC